VQVLVAGGGLEPPATAAEHPMAGTAEAGELLDVDLEQLAGARALVPVGRLERLEARALAEPDSLQNCRDG
jgi:hypothetical protein